MKKGEYYYSNKYHMVCLVVGHPSNDETLAIVCMRTAARKFEFGLMNESDAVPIDIAIELQDLREFVK